MVCGNGEGGVSAGANPSLPSLYLTLGELVVRDNRQGSMGQTLLVDHGGPG